MKVSIVIPVYNVAPYITRCLDSVAAQTYTDIECILVDDCGTDNSIQIAEQYIHEYKGPILFTILHHLENQGQSAARNTGLEVASGEYIYFLDSDDAITPGCIEILIGLAIRYPDADFVQGQTVNNEPETVELHYMNQFPEYERRCEQLCFLMLRHTMPSGCNKLIKHSFITDNSLYFPVGIVHEDLYWLFFVMKCVNSIAFTNSGTYFYYENRNSTMNSTSTLNLKKRALGYKTSITTFTEDILKNGSVSKYQRQYVADAILNYALLVNKMNSISFWFEYWLHVSTLAMKSIKKLSVHRMYFFFCMMPPLCFLTKYHWWLWRIRHYVISKV